MTPELRVLHVTTVPTSLMFLDGQSSFMREHGVVLFAISSPGNDLDAWGNREQVSTFGVPMARQITPFSDLVALARIIGVIRKVRPHIVHSHTPKGGLLGTLAAAVCAVPTRIYHLRGLPLTTARGIRRVLLATTERIASGAATQVLCVSRSLREVAITERLCAADRINVLEAGSGNGVDAAERFNPERLPSGTRNETRRGLQIDDDALVIGFVGRLVRDKGIGELVEAWARVRGELPASARLLVVGPYEERDPVAGYVRDALERDPTVVRVDFTRDTPVLYAAMDVVVLPTYREGFPNVPLEAAAMGLPVIATRIPGCIDAVDDGETGTLVPVRDVEALASAMLTYATDAQLRARHGHAGRARVLSRFSRAAMHRALLTKYLELTARPFRDATPVTRRDACAE
ncbi:MAG: glycosyltransferase family 4 protein [Myxococcota bacterium]|nr:glycosyltransferase family 4 protein [Myxococcota bacterium]